MGSCIPTILSCCYKGQVKDFSEISAPLNPDEADAKRVQRWSSKLHAFRSRNRWFGAGGSVPSIDDLIIALLLSLYSGVGDKWERAQQEAAISRDLITLHGRDPAAVEFYIPQLCTYLALQQFSGSPDVQDFLLARFSRCDLRLAHRVYWHLQSFCERDPFSRSFRYKVEEEGCRGAALFNERLHEIDIYQISARTSDSQASPDRRSKSRDVSKDRGKSRGRRVVESDNAPESTPTVDFKARSLSSGSNSAAAIGVIARDLAGSPQHFHSGLYFIEALTSCSEELVSIPLGQRQESMVAKLERLNEFFLSEAARSHGGSDVIYIPFGSSFYQVLSIYPQECITFSTKERVPMLVCLEVRAIPLEELTSLRRRHRGRSDLAAADEISLVNTWKETIANNIASLRERFPLEFAGRVRSPLDVERDTPKESEPELDMQLDVGSPTKTQLLAESNSRSNDDDEVGLSHLGQWRDAPSGTQGKVVDRLMTALTDTLGSMLGAANSESPRLDSSPNQENFHQVSSEGNAKGEVRPVEGKETPLLSSDDDYNRRMRSYSAAIHASGFFNGGGVEPETMQRKSSIDDESVISSGDLQEHHSKVIFAERWSEKEERLWQEKKGSAGPRQGWKLLPIIVKANDDLRQEQAVSQMVKSLHRIFIEGDVGVWLHPYEILATSPTAGLLEAIPDTVSLHALKRNAPGISLPEFFKRHFGAPGGVSLKRARSNFVESCAGYAIVCYLLQVKDRHNGNILLDAEGHLVHIDWGFVLGQSPGHNLGFESAPFKLTLRHVEVMGGPMSFSFQRFRNLCVRAFLEARRNSEKLILLVEMLAEGYPDLPCFSHSSPAAVCEALRERFLPGRTTGQCVEFVIQMIDDSMASWSTPLYDKFQRCCVGIF